MNVFKLSILSCDHMFYQGDCESLVIPTSNGELGILASHCNLVAAIIPGTVKFKVDDKWRYASVSDGIVKVEKGEVLLLVNTIERPEDIDIDVQKHLIAQYNEELQQKKSITDYYMSKARLARSLARLKTKNYDNDKI